MSSQCPHTLLDLKKGEGICRVNIQFYLLAHVMSLSETELEGATAHSAGNEACLAPAQNYKRARWSKTPN